MAVPVLFFSGWLKGPEGIDFKMAVTLLGSLYIVGAVLMKFLPETKGQDLIE